MALRRSSVRISLGPLNKALVLSAFCLNNNFERYRQPSKSWKTIGKHPLSNLQLSYNKNKCRNDHIINKHELCTMRKSLPLERTGTPLGAGGSLKPSIYLGFIINLEDSIAIKHLKLDG